MNTVDALNILGKALCGDSFEVKPGLTDAETILEIAKNYTGESSSGPTIYEFLLNESGTGDHYAEGPTGLTYDDFAGVWIQFNKSNGLDGTRPYVLFPVLRMEPEYDGEGHILYTTIGIWKHDPGDPPMYGQNVSYDPESGKLYIPD